MKNHHFTLDLGDYKQLIEKELPRLQMCLTAASSTIQKPQRSSSKAKIFQVIIAIASEKYLILIGCNKYVEALMRTHPTKIQTDAQLYVDADILPLSASSSGRNRPGSDSYDSTASTSSLQTALQFSSESGCGLPTALGWIVECEVICVGFETGTLDDYLDYYRVIMYYYP